MFLVVGFSIGASKLAGQHGYQLDEMLGSYISVHPALMVFGVIGGLLLAEKIEIMNKFLILGRIPISYTIVLTLLLGVLFLSLGYGIDFSILKYAGSALIALAGILFLWFMVSRRNPGNTGIKLIMGAALMALSISSIAESITSATDSSSVALLLLSFPILYILGERIELGQMRNIGNSKMRMLFISAILIPVFLFVSILLQFRFIDQVLFDGSILFLTLMVYISIKFDPLTRKLKIHGKFQSFMQLGVVSSYAWLLVGIVLYFIQVNVERGFMDPATHSIALGFIGLFIIAHSPIIFPLTLKLRVDTTRVTKLPLYAMNLAVFLRVGGDLISTGSNVGNIMAYSSIYVLILAVLLFFMNIMKIRINTNDTSNAAAKNSG